MGLRTRVHVGDPIWGQAEPGFSSFKNMTRQTVAILQEGQFECKDTTFNFPTVSQLVQTSSSHFSRGTFSTRRVPVIKRAAVLCSRSRRSALIVPRPLQARDAYSRTGRTQVRKRVYTVFEAHTNNTPVCVLCVHVLKIVLCIYPTNNHSSSLCTMHNGNCDGSSN